MPSRSESVARAFRLESEFAARQHERFGMRMKHSSMPAQILHVLGSSQRDWTGIARIVAMLSEGLDPGRYRLHACFLGGDGPLQALLRDQGVPVVGFEWLTGVCDPLGAWEFCRNLRGHRFDLVHLHFGGRAVRYLTRWASGAPVLLHLHSRVLESGALRPSRLTGAGADLVVTVSLDIARAVCGAKRPPLVIHSGVTIPPASDRPATTTAVVGTVARLAPVKGLEVLLRAYAHLQREFPDLLLEIAGEGPSLPALRSLASELAAGKQARFLGWQQDPTAILASWNVYICSSYDEGLPLSLLEAMAAGLPVVASKVGGIPEAVVHGSTGWLVEPGDERALAAAIANLLRNRERAQAMGTAGRQRINEHFSPGTMVEAMSAAYDELLR